MKFIEQTGPIEAVTFSSTIAIILAQNATPDEVDALGNLFSAIGANLNVIASQLEFCVAKNKEDSKEQDNNSNDKNEGSDNIKEKNNKK